MLYYLQLVWHSEEIWRQRFQLLIWYFYLSGKSALFSTLHYNFKKLATHASMLISPILIFFKKDLALNVRSWWQ